ncbi:hypothetical protein Lal_00020751 [Lupinus albus]|nr:hypothetical protein Lal_00020751 [Lupinus albus]
MQNSSVNLVARTLYMSTNMRVELHNVSGAASQTRQVFFVSDPANKKWYVVLFTNKIIINNNIDDQEDIDAEDNHF